MGWNTGYEIMEATVIGAYNLGRLDKRLLKVLMEPYRGTDIDSGGSCDLRTRDGLGVEDVVCKVLGVQMPKKPKLPRDSSKWTEAQDDADRDYWNARYKAFGKATKRYGW